MISPIVREYEKQLNFDNIHGKYPVEFFLKKFIIGREKKE